MTSLVFRSGVLIIQLLLIYSLSRISIDEIYIVLKRFTKNQDVSLAILSIIFLPGTVVHELSHFIVAMILLLKVADMQIFPKWDDNSIRLGSVLYERKDIVRGFLVGIAPLFFGLIVFMLLSIYRIFPHESIFVNVVMTYIIFTISSTMFSSKQDLQDFIFIIPFIVIIGIIFYIFDIRFAVIIKDEWRMILLENITKISGWLYYPLIIHSTLIVLFKSFGILKKQ